MLEEGKNRACSAIIKSIAILKVTEHLAADEAKDIDVLKINDKVYRVQFYLGGDLKCLAVGCGIEAATCEHACVWCKCISI